jgi:hypothetical protein
MSYTNEMKELIEPTKETSNLAELDIQIATAHRYPRDIPKVLEEALTMIRSNKEIAASCTYSVPRKQDGKTIYITGGSIRLAEIFSQCWGNLHAGTRILPHNDGKTIVAEAVAWDLEKNIKFITQCTRSIYSYKSKRTYSHDMQVITANAAASIALRNAIFRVVPNAYTDRLHKEAVDFANSGSNREIMLARVFTYFTRVGYSEQHVLMFLQRATKADVTREDITILSGIKNRIDDGQLPATKSLPLTDADFADPSTPKLDQDFFSEETGNK